MAERDARLDEHAVAVRPPVRDRVPQSRERPGCTVPGAPGTLSTASDTSVDAELTIAEQEALLGWLADVEDQAGDEDDAAALRRRLAGVLANLPEALKRHLEALLQLENRIVETRQGRAAQVDRIAEIERAELEESLRRLARTLHGALMHCAEPPPAASTPAAPCGATCGSTEYRSCRSRCGAPRTGHGWSYSLT